MRKIVLCFICLFCFTTILFAGGKREKENRDVEKMDSWKETFDISRKKTGKYNIVVTATDIGGNDTLAGPFNVFIDPDSDLPVCSITNPRQDMCLPGNLNIVGTCVDDDAVERVEIILDGDKNNPLICEGKDYWSYYLDTNDMAEGPHTLSVYGIDINGVKGKPQNVTWHLNRRSPTTVVNSHEMGMLVAGKQKITGVVADGNGIASLSFSTDGGQTFEPIKLKIKKKSDKVDFEYILDTFKLEDGPQVSWFKAVDKMGTVGMYSFLFFVDNTKPDLQIVSPTPTEFVNGRFAIAGFAKDTIGMKSLTWAFAGTSGEIELIPGNPYFTIDCDVRNIVAKEYIVSVTGTDTAGNVSTISQKILVNAELDKPKVALSLPLEGSVVFDDVYLAGLATDDDGVEQVFYSVDGGEAVSVVTDGAFEATVSGLSAGNHTLKVWAKDIDGIEGNASSVSFIASGEKPLFEEFKLSSAGTETICSPGIAINPEKSPVIKTKVISGCGLQSVTWQISGKDEVAVNLPDNTKNGFEVNIPVADTRWGFIDLRVTAIDIYNRKVENIIPLYVENLTKTRGMPAVVFEDSTVSEDGLAVFSDDISITGFFVGGTAQSVRLVPNTNFGSVSLSGNSILLSAGMVYGTSEPVKVEVTTTKGFKYYSKDLRLCRKAPKPVITLSDNSVRDGNNSFKVSGVIKSDLPIINVKYRFIVPSAQGNSATEFYGADFAGKTFDIKVDEDFVAQVVGDNVAVLEVVATDSGNSSSANAVIVNRVPVMNPGAKGVPKSQIFWIEGECKDIYYATYNAGEMAPNIAVTINGSNVETNGVDYVFAPQGGRISTRNFAPGATTIEVATLTVASRQITGKYTAQIAGDVKMKFVSVGDVPYRSGMEVVVSNVQGGAVPPSLVIQVDSSLAVSDIVADVNGKTVKAVLRKNEGSQTYFADLSLAGISADILKIKATATLSGGSVVSTTGNISVLRTKDASQIADSEKVWWTNAVGEDGFYTIDTSVTELKTLNAYGNFIAPLTVSFDNPVFGLNVNAEGKTIVISAEKEGEYKNIVLKVKDAEGFEYKSSPVSIRVDNSAPVLDWKFPTDTPWIQDKLRLGGFVTENVGVAKSVWTVDGETWNELKLSEPLNGRRTFDSLFDVSSAPDGIITAKIAITDNAGKKTEMYKTVHKDTTAPNVSVLLPDSQAMINGETTVVFNIEDAGFDKAEYVRGKDRFALTNGPLLKINVGTETLPLSETMVFEFTDKAGNKTVKNTWDFTIDNEKDLPVAEIHVPQEMEIIQTDFVISGVVYDDDGESKIWYKIDDNEFVALDGYGSSFSINVPLSTMTDNEHSVTVFAEDINGVRGKEVVRNFRISLEEPKGEVLSPKVDETVKGVVTLSGVTSDKNGIDRVEISIDNGNSYIVADGKEEWSYKFDTHIIEDGTYVIFLRVWDNYGIQGLYSSLMNIDNTAPDIHLELPIDDAKTSGMLFFSGQTTDNIGLEKLYIRIRNLDKAGKEVPKKLAQIDLVPDDIITRSVDISELPDGFYNIEITGEDNGGNISRVSRNIQLDRSLSNSRVDILYPLSKEKTCGNFNLYGKVVSEKQVDSLMLYVDNENIAQTTLSDSGYYKFELNSELITTGEHKVKVRAVLSNSEIVESAEQILNYSSFGPWITVDSLAMGDFAVDRPYMKGKSGYILSDEDRAILGAKETSKEEKQVIQSKTSVKKVEISFDNGKTFTEIADEKNWKYRIENQDMTEGYHFMVLKASMKSGDYALCRMIIQVDKTAPYIRLISPVVGGAYNQEIEFSGLASDDVKLQKVNLALRSGDKASYEVPGFIQGLYFDGHFWGASLWDVGMGLTFFDDNVKLQLQYGQFTDEQWAIFNKTGEQKRYGGHIFGTKLLANIAYLPFSYIAGPDWAWLSASVAVGANFSLFTETQSGKPQMLSAFLAQLEFPRITSNKRSMFRTFSFYTEFQLWFASTDIDTSNLRVAVSTFVPHITGGIRLNVF
ncbi:MAG: hypothetical protein GX220_06920 [Treponema sp.]|nr:hypothetical protein [Treponema sp.]